MYGELGTVLIAVALVWSVTIFWRVTTKARHNPRNLPYPPGPKPLPIVGNLYDVPKDPFWRGYALLSQKFGDILFLRIFGQPVVVLGTAQVATDLLYRRSAIYSDRMHTTMVSLMGWDWNMALMPYGTSWRNHRREFQEYFRKSLIGSYTGMQERQTLKFLRALLKQPENFASLVHLWFGATAFKIVYGIEVDDLSNEYLQVAEEAVKGGNEGLMVGRFLVDFIPVLRYVPEWMPGAEFKRKAAIWKRFTIDSKELPFQAARSVWSKDKAPECIVDQMLDKLNHRPNEVDEELLKNVAGIAFFAGSDTSLSTAQSFFLAMAMYPEAQKKAQDELDSVVGPDRLPQSDDRPSLPYIEAIMREALRWQPVVPLGVPHSTIADDEYRGYFIPKGTLVIANQWAMLQDPNVYPDPERFSPDRYIKNGKLDPLVADPTTVAFGFGRRICPGQHFAEHSLFLFFASVLHVFEISPPLDKHGQPIQLEAKMTTGPISFPEPFNCIIKPRSPARAALLSERDEQ